MVHQTAYQKCQQALDAFNHLEIFELLTQELNNFIASPSSNEMSFTCLWVFGHQLSMRPTVPESTFAHFFTVLRQQLGKLEKTSPAYRPLSYVLYRMWLYDHNLSWSWAKNILLWLCYFFRFPLPKRYFEPALQPPTEKDISRASYQHHLPSSTQTATASLRDLQLYLSATGSPGKRNSLVIADKIQRASPTLQDRLIAILGDSRQEEEMWQWLLSPECLDNYEMKKNYLKGALAVCEDVSPPFFSAILWIEFGLSRKIEEDVWIRDPEASPPNQPDIDYLTEYFTKFSDRQKTILRPLLASFSVIPGLFTLS